MWKRLPRTLVRQTAGMLLHLSDVHVTDPDSAIARFADGEARLTAVIDHLLAAQVPLDGVLLTGDLVDHGTDDEYDRLLAQLDRLPCPWRPLPGNHDLRPGVDRVLAAAGVTGELGTGPEDPVAWVADLGPLRVVGVDSSRPGHHDGAWDDRRLRWLDEALARDVERPTLVATHHPPVSTGLWHMDYGGAHGGEAMAEVVARHPQVEAVVCGHVHRRLVLRWAGTLLCTAPSLTFLTEAVLDDGADPVLHAGLPELPLYRLVDGRFAVDSLDWQPGRSPVPFPLVLGDGWDAYAAAARSGTLPRTATGH